jgi:hypothetical protein
MSDGQRNPPVLPSASGAATLMHFLKKPDFRLRGNERRYQLGADEVME